MREVRAQVVYPYRPRIGVFKKVGAAQQRRLPRTGGADYRNDIALVHMKIYPVKNRILAERLSHLFYLKHSSSLNKAG
jgi:hypothetical protein